MDRAFGWRLKTCVKERSENEHLYLDHATTTYFFIYFLRHCLSMVELRPSSSLSTLRSCWERVISHGNSLEILRHGRELNSCHEQDRQWGTFVLSMSYHNPGHRKDRQWETSVFSLSYHDWHNRNLYHFFVLRRFCDLQYFFNFSILASFKWWDWFNLNLNFQNSYKEQPPKIKLGGGHHWTKILFRSLIIPYRTFLFYQLFHQRFPLALAEIIRSKSN